MLNNINKLLIKYAQTDRALQALSKLTISLEIQQYLGKLLHIADIGNELFGEAVGFLFKNKDQQDQKKLESDLRRHISENVILQLLDKSEENDEKLIEGIRIENPEIKRWCINQVKKDPNNLKILKDKINDIIFFIKDNDIKYQGYDLRSLLKLMHPDYLIINKNNIVHENDNLFILELTDPIDLRAEGTIQQHCLKNSNWAKRIKIGELRIFSLRDKSAPYIPLATIQTDPLGIVIRSSLGKNNKPISDEYKKFISEWSNKKLLKERDARYYIMYMPDSDLRDLARSKFTSPIVLDILFKTKLNELINELSRNEALTADMLNIIYDKYKKNEFILEALAQNISCDTQLLNTLVSGNFENDYINKLAKETLLKKLNKKAYFQGTEEPTPKKKQYKSDPAIVVQPRFEEPFYRNYDLYDVPGVSEKPKHGPGTGYTNLNKHKSINEFRKNKKKLKYKADDTYIHNDGSKKKHAFRMSILKSIVKNAIDFQVDEQINSPSIGWENGMYDAVSQIGGRADYNPQDDVDGKSQETLDFGHDIHDTYKDPNELFGLDISKLDGLINVYLDQSNMPLYGLDDGLPEEELFEDISDDEGYGTTDSGNTVYNKRYL